MGSNEVIEDYKDITRLLKQQRTKDFNKLKRQQEYIDNLAIEFCEFYENCSSDSKGLSVKYKNLYKLLRHGRKELWDNSLNKYKKF